MLYPTALVLLLLAGSVFGNLIYNGDFELGNTGFTTQYTYSFDLTVSGTIVVGENPNSYHPWAASYGDHSSGFGRMLIANGATETGRIVWEQTVSVDPDTEYIFFYWLSNWTDDDIRLAQIQCLINGLHAGLGFAPAAVGEWKFVYHRWNSGTNTEAKIRLINRIRAEVSNDFAIDDIGMFEIGDDYVLVSSSTPGGSVIVPGEGVFFHPEGETVYFEAKCEPGYEFAGWTGNSFTTAHWMWVTMDMDYLAIAQFKKPDYDLTIRASAAAPDRFSACSDSADRLSLVRDCLQSQYPGGLTFGQTKGMCEATYVFPIVNPQAKDISKIVVNAYGTTASTGARVYVGELGPYRPVVGDVHEVFTGNAVKELLGVAKERICWLPVTISGWMGVWDLASIHVSYECASIPKAMLRRFHDHLSIQQALAHYAQDRSLRDLFALKASDPDTWETLVQTLALTEDLAGQSAALQSAVIAEVDALPSLLDRWASLGDAPDLTLLAKCGSEAIPAALDKAVASGEAYATAHAEAIVDGRISMDEAGDLNGKMGEWKLDLTDVKSTMADVFDVLGRTHQAATAPQDRALRDAAEMLIRAMSPWYTGEPDPDDPERWLASSPTYLEEAIGSLQDVPTESISVP
jgi:hypothetical protein